MLHPDWPLPAYMLPNVMPNNTCIEPKVCSMSRFERDKNDCNAGLALHLC